MCCISVFINFLYLLQTLQCILIYLDSTEDILILFCDSFIFIRENKFVYSNKLLTYNMKSLRPIQKHLHIIESYACICYNIFVCNEFSIFFWNIFNSKTIKVCYIFSIHIQSNPMSSY